jgi:hypothetical protein
VKYEKKAKNQAPHLVHDEYLSKTFENTGNESHHF